MDREAHRLIEEAPLVLCDFDGTLARLAVSWADLKVRLRREAVAMGASWRRPEGMDANLRRLRRERGEDVFRRLCRLAATAEIAGFAAGAVNMRLVDVLRVRGGRPLGVVSLNTRALLEHAFSQPAFDGLAPLLVGKEDVLLGKPDPEGLLAACRQAGLAPENTLYVGDADTDRQAAEAAGCAYLDVRDGFSF